MTRFSNSLSRRHNERDCISNHQCLERLLNCSFRRRSKNTSKLRVTGICEGKPLVTSGFPSQMASSAEKVPFDDIIMCNKIYNTVIYENKTGYEHCYWCKSGPFDLEGYYLKITLCKKLIPLLIHNSTRMDHYNKGYVVCVCSFCDSAWKSTCNDAFNIQQFPILAKILP